MGGLDGGPDRVLPHHLAAERAVLGAILLHPETLDVVAGELRPEHFFRRAHQCVYEVMLQLQAGGRVMDFLTLEEALRRAGALEEVGGPAYLSALVDGMPHGTPVAQHAALVRETWVLRRIIGAADIALTEAYAADETGAAVLAKLDHAVVALQQGAPEGARSLAATAPALIAAMDDRVQHKGTLTGLATGFSSIDQLTGGWQPGELHLIAARPALGKTALSLNTALAAARAGHSVVFCSLEMRRRALEFRILSSVSQIPLSRLMSGYVLGEAEAAALGAALAEMSALPIYIDDRGGRTIQEIRVTCRRTKAEHGCALVVVDYVQLIPGSLVRRGATRTEELTDISRRLKELADELQVPVIALSQLSRGTLKGVETRPQLTQLRDCGSLEQDGDLVAFLHRRNHREGGYTAFIAEKQRNGPTGTLGLMFDRDTVTFTDGGEEPTANRATAG